MLESEISREDDGGLSLMDILTALGKEKLTLFLVTGLITLYSVVQSLLATPIYTSRTVIMLAQQGGGASLSLSNLGALSGIAGISGLTGAMKSSEDLYISLMRSNTVQDSLIEKLKLKERYGSRVIEEARRDLTYNVSLSTEKKSNLIVIEANDTDPQFAAKLANQQVEELKTLLNRLAVTEAQQRRLYYEEQIKKTQVSRAEAEVRFKRAQKESGMQLSSIIADSSLQASVGIKGQIASREIQSQAMSRFATAQNPDMQRISSELAALHTQLLKFELGTERTIGTPLQQETLQAYRELKVQEAMLNSFISQFEMAKFEESKEGQPIQVVDPALPPEIRSKPVRRTMVLNGGLVGLLLGILAALVKYYLGKLKISEEGNLPLQELKRSWSFK